MRTRTLFLAEIAGHYAGKLAARYPERAQWVLEALERRGVRSVGWALIALDLRRVGGSR